jgi:hypothetical protein
MSIDLYFPKLNGGVEHGLNDAGIETFEGDFQQHIIRECTQNALDARLSANSQVRIAICLREIPAKDIPGLSSLRNAIKSSREYWHGNEKTEAFCSKALAWTDGQNITVLEVSDYGTKGLDGQDGDRNGSWFGLVQSGGVAIKADDAGGAFGIGKKAPFVGSFARTIFYSTLNASGGTAFQGVTTLTTHLDSTNEKTQSIGFIGHVEKKFSRCRSVREPNLIPLPFRRTEIGTSIFIIAYRQLSGDDWAEIFIREAVQNFWPAIHRGSLVFEIGGQRLDNYTLSSLMAKYSSDPSFSSRFYYRAVANHSRKVWQKNLPELGSCRLYLVAGDATYPKKVCMTRQIGMIIYTAQRFRSYSPFAGLFICESQEGNAYLRRLEPPRHDEWNANRSDDPGEANRVLQNVRNWINECLRELNPDEDVKESDIPELNRYLPDEEDEKLGGDSENVQGQGGEDGLVRLPVVRKLIFQPIPLKMPSSKRPDDPILPEEGNEEGDGSGIGSPDPDNKPNNTKGGNSPTTGGGASGDNLVHGPKTYLHTRAVFTSPNTYDLVIRSSISCSGRLKIVGVGEDNKEDSDLTILRIIEISSSHEIKLDNFTIEGGQKVALRVIIESTTPLSLRAYCYGN